MGKDKKNSDLIGHNSNDTNETIEENKENSLEDKNSLHSSKSSKISSKLSSTNSEVLEDENSSDSTTSSDTKASSSNLTINSSSTSTSTATTSTKTKTLPRSNKKSSKSNKKVREEEEEDEEKEEEDEKEKEEEDEEEEEKEEEDEEEDEEKEKEDEEKEKEDEEKEEEDEEKDDEEKEDKKKKEEESKKEKDETDKEEKPQFRIASNNSTGFKLRIVPLEKLLEKPTKEVTKKEKSRSSSPILPKKRVQDKKPERSSINQQVRRLPERSRKPTSFVEISDSESEEELSDSKSSSESDVQPLKKIAAKRQAPKRQAKSNPRPPSPSSVKRCLVKLKRSKLSDFKNLKSSTTSNNKKGKMNGKSEKPSTSSARKKRMSSDDDSDFDAKQGSDEDRVSVAGDNSSDSQRDSSDSEVIPTRKRRVFIKGKKNSDNSDTDFEPEAKPKKKRRRVQKNSSDDSDEDDDGNKKDKTKRKDIRKIIKTSDLNISTKTATKEEEERRKRIEERQKLYNQIYEKPDSVEVDELVLDFDAKSKKTLLEVDKGLMKKLKPHQVTGVKFMWDACFETIEDAQEKPGSGCILAHCMGLGKTMQIVTLSHTLLANSSKTNVERVLIISPLSTLNNWAREFKHWISFTRKRNIEIYDMSKYKDKNTRIFKLNEWFEEGGVCIMGYDMYRILTNEKAKGLKKKQREHLQQSLVEPGPDLVVCDEGHLLKNEKTSISKAVTRMRTLRRIVLTGTPLQNNLKEYYCMIQFIKPNLLGTYKEYLNRFVNPITNGQYADSTDRDMRLMKHRSHILHQLLQGCIQRRDYSVLAPYLPPKHEYVVYTTLSMTQQLIYEHYMTHQRDVGNSMADGKGARLFQDFQELRRIWTHPMNMRINSDTVIRKKVLANETDSMEDFIDDDNDDEDDAVDSSSDNSGASSKSFGSGGGGKGRSARKAPKTRNFRRNAADKGEEIDSDIEEIAPIEQDDPSEWWKRFVSDKELNNVHHSPKLVMLMRLLEQCEKIGDKLLVFSQSLQSLDTIEHFLSLVDSKTRGYEYEGDVGECKGFWTPGTDYFRLDGSCSVEQREAMCKKFNDATNLRGRLFLISTRAGGLGINLVSANRVVIFDVSWNPSHDTQSIFRVYRFGQIKPCYIYRLIAMGTMEQKLYERQVAKQATAKRVIDEQQISRHYNQSDLQELYTYELKPVVPREIPILPKDRLFAELLSQHEELLFKYHEHDSLLENEESENLSESERKEAWSEFEAEKTRTVQTAQFMSYDRAAYGAAIQYGNAGGSVTSNKIFGFRSDVLLQLLNMKIAKDHPEMTQNQVIQVVPSYLNQLYSEMNSGDPSMYKDLLMLHGSLAHPSGMYMNPLLYANQNPGAAGYYQANMQPVSNGMGMMPNQAVMAPSVVAKPAAGFDPNEVYEID